MKARTWSGMAAGAVLFLLGAGMAAAQDEAPVMDSDPRMRDLLKEAELVYDVDEDGEFRLLLEFDGGRSQQVFIRSETFKLEDLEVREIYSPAAMGDTLRHPQTMELLLRANNEVIIGSWEYQRMNTDVAIFCVRFPADPGAALLRRLVGTVGQVADEMELELSGRDDL